MKNGFMDKSKPERKSIYLTNLLFLLIDKYWSDPNIVGQKVAGSITRAIEMVCPTRRKFNGTEEQRSLWLRKFTFSLIKGLGSEYTNSGV